MKIKCNKAIGRNLCRRTTRQWRGRKFIVWVPWTIDEMKDTACKYGLDLDGELMKCLEAEMKAEFGGRDFWDIIDSEADPDYFPLVSFVDVKPRKQ